MVLVDIPELDDDILQKISSLSTRNNSQQSLVWEKVIVNKTILWIKIYVYIFQLVNQVQHSYQQTHCDLRFRQDAEKDSRLKSYIDVTEKEWENTMKG